MKSGAEQGGLRQNKTKKFSKSNSSVEPLRKDIEGLDGWFENLEKPLTVEPDVFPTTKEPKSKQKRPKRRKYKKRSFIKLSSDYLNRSCSSTGTDRKILSLRLSNGIELEFWQ